MKLLLSMMLPVLILTGCASEPPRKANVTVETEPFRHIKGFHVGVEKLNPRLEKDGLQRDQLQADVEGRLRQAGVKVLTLDEYKASGDMPTVIVNVSATRRDDGSYLYHTSLDVLRRLRSLRPEDAAVTLAEVHALHGPVSATKGSDLKEIRDDVKRLTDQLISQFLDQKALEWRQY